MATSPTRRNSTRILLFAACCALAGTAAAENARLDRDAMADVMSRMMEAMGFLDDTSRSSAFRSIPAPPAGVPGAPYIGPSWAPGMPWSGSGWPPIGSPETGGSLEPLARHWPGSRSVASGWRSWMAGPLEGLWESPDGGLLVVQGDLYRLYQPGAGYVDGELRLDNDELVMRNRQRGFEHRFELAIRGDRLALRSEDGQIFVYRRLQLNRQDLR